jgi:DNA-binding response OmpR family regulator
VAKKKWILLMDDDPTISTVLEAALSHRGLTITTAQDALQAFIQARDLVPLLIMNGRESFSRRMIRPSG